MLSAATDARSTAFTSAYRRVTGALPSPATALQYDALMLLMTAVREVGANRKAIQAYLSALGGSRPPAATAGDESPPYNRSLDPREPFTTASACLAAATRRFDPPGSNKSSPYACVPGPYPD